jgi:TetR/AcrR family tetracycline transcriptional repressor
VYNYSNHRLFGDDAWQGSEIDAQTITSPDGWVTKKPTKRRGRPPLRAGNALDRQQIVTAALALIDRGGLEGFSLRRLSRELKVYPTAIYWHLPGGRNELLGAVAATAFEDVTPSFREGDDWTRWLRSLFRNYRRSLHRHPNIAPLLGAQLVSNSGIDPAFVEQILAVLESAGFTKQDLVDAYNTVIAVMLGFVTLELAPVPLEDPTNWARRFEASVRSLDPARFPRLTRHMGAMANQSFVLRWESGKSRPLNSAFDTYVEVAISGLRSILGRNGR